MAFPPNDEISNWTSNNFFGPLEMDWWVPRSLKNLIESGSAGDDQRSPGSSHSNDDGAPPPTLDP